MKKLLSILIVMILTVGSGAFYAGMKYQESTRRNFAEQNLNLSPEQRQQLTRGRTGRGAGANFLTGEVVAKDEQSLTLKMPNGGSKIVFFSDSTEITKSVKGSVNDFEIGKTAIVEGKQNSDGSFTAETVQMRSDLQNRK